MELETMQKAVSIVRYKEELKSELRDWEELTRTGVVSPLTFRLGKSIDHIDEEIFNQFKSANISWIKAKIVELDSDLANL